MARAIERGSGWRLPSLRHVGTRRLRDFTEVELEQVTPTAWWVCDARVALDSPRRLLGCIDHHGDVFELMQLGEDFSWHSFGSLREALEHAARTAPAIAAQLSPIGRAAGDDRG